MLILQRKAGQAVHIGDDVVVSVVSIDSSRVRLSIEAPNHISILRSELVEAKQTNRESIAEPAAASALLSLLEPKQEPSSADSSDQPPPKQ